MRRSLTATDSSTDFVYKFREPVSLSWRRATAVCIGFVLGGITASLYAAPARYDVGQLRIALLIATLGFALYAVGVDRQIRRLRNGSDDLRAAFRLLERENDALVERERAAQTEAEQSSRDKNDFMASITHELKTPLTSLLGYATILRRRSDSLRPEQRVECFDIMERQGQRILRMIEDILQSSRIESGLSTVKRESIDLQTVVIRTVETFASMLAGHGLRVDMPDGDLGLFGDETALEHVISNLIDNAVKHAPAGTAIMLAIIEAGPEVHVSVGNEGPVIPKEDLAHIFERFVQSDGARDRRSVGLGLSIVRSLLKSQGGRIWVTSDAETGTTFTFALPRRDPSVTDALVS